MNRLLFEKNGKAIYISHLDLMAMFPRIFQRAGLHLKFTQGMSPRAYVSIALPLSLGVSSQCELLDFELLDDNVPIETLPELLNPFFPAGIRIISAYESDKKPKNLKYLQYSIRLEYDNGVGDGQLEKLRQLFDRREIVIEKKSKKGMTDTDIKPMIENLYIARISEQELEIQAMLCAQNPSLNPQYLIAAVERYLPDCVPDFYHSHRVEIYDENMTVFR